AGRHRRRAARGVRAEGSARVSRLHHRPDGKRVSDGAGWQGADRDDPRGRTLIWAPPEAWGDHETYPVDPRRERGGRAVADFRALLGTPLQHRIPDGRADRGAHKGPG